MDGRHKLSTSGATSTRDFERVLAEIGPGKLLGVVERLPSGAEYFVFKGIPYAKAPVGELRFQVNGLVLIVFFGCSPFIRG